VLRNEHFAPSTLPSHDREKLVTVSVSREQGNDVGRRYLFQLKSTKQLLGRSGDRFLLLGMLGHSKEGKLSLEDADGRVDLDFSKLVRHS
jgi:DNA polymerase epsilon subunit 2